MGRESFEDDSHIRTTALRLDIPCITTLSGATAAVEGIAAQRAQPGFDVRSLQSLKTGTRRRRGSTTARARSDQLDASDLMPARIETDSLGPIEVPARRLLGRLDRARAAQLPGQRAAPAARGSCARSR